MRRVLVPANLPLRAESELTFDDEIHHHLIRVLRLAEGTQLELCNGQGTIATGVLTGVSKTQSSYRCHRVHTVERQPGRHLLVALLKGDKMDWVVQKACELGASRITPVLCERSVPKGNHAKRQERWQKIIRAAAMQSEANYLPVMDGPMRLAEALEQSEGRRLWAAERSPGGGDDWASVLASGQAACCLVGPEGGWSPGEAERITAAGFRPISLGPQILRAETATVAALAIIGHLQRMTDATQSG